MKMISTGYERKLADAFYAVALTGARLGWAVRGVQKFSSPSPRVRQENF
jgi:hypothetical protein